MHFFSKEIHKFTVDYFYKGEVYPFYSDVKNRFSLKQESTRTFPALPAEKKIVHVINDIPPYLDLEEYKNKGWRCIAIKKYQGFMADLRDFGSFEEYLNGQFSKNGRANLRRSIRRLESCFDIRYECYYGDITKATCETLLEKMHALIDSRFRQKGLTHQALPDWGVIKSNARRQILNKNASLFVIYNGELPIDICLNYHNHGIVNNLLCSFDIDYAKFSLGAIDLYKQMEWYYGLGFKVFDLSRGDLLYKRQWCNHQYPFLCHIHYPESSLRGMALAYSLAALYLGKERLKMLKAEKFKIQLQQLFRKDKNRAHEAIAPAYVMHPHPCPDRAMQPLPGRESDHYPYLRRAIYDFQYLNEEHYRDIRVYKIEGPDVAFLVSGRKSCARLQRPC